MIWFAIAIGLAATVMGVIGVVEESPGLVAATFVTLAAIIPLMYAWTGGGRQGVRHH